MADVLFSDLIEKVYRRVMGGIRERTVTLNGNALSTDLTITLAGPQTVGIAPGSILAVDMEIIYVTLWNPSTLVATVIRGYLGSTKAAHTSGVLCYISPRYSRYDIGIAINDDISSMSSPANGLYRVGVASVSYNAVFMGYDLGGISDNFNDILNVRYATPLPFKNFPAVKRWSIHRNIPDPAFPSGNGMIVYDGGWPGMDMYVTYTAPFLPLVLPTDSILNTPVGNDLAEQKSG